MKKIMYLAFALLVMVSCKKKSSDTNTTTPSKDQLVGTYKQTGQTSNGVDTWASTVPACQRDNTTELKADNTYVETDAGVTCTSNPTPTTGTWSISGSTFTMDGQAMTVQSFNGTTLVLQMTGSSGGYNYTLTSTFTKQ